MKLHRPLSLAARWAAIVLLCSSILGSAQEKGVWLTTPDRSNLLSYKGSLNWKRASTVSSGTFVIDDTKRYQTMDGFGHALTGGSAQLMMKMSSGARSRLLHELFGNGKDAVAMNYIRVSIGASDMNAYVYTYDDLNAGERDPNLKQFSLAEDERNVIPVLKEIIAIQPRIKILASPWTAPSWMKDNDNPKGGTLQTQYYQVYANYLAKYLEEFNARGITIDALTPQNEPENPKNTPSMLLDSNQEAEFIGKYLGPTLARAGLKTKIVNFDHNCDHPNYSIDLLRNADAFRYTDGSGFHLYLGSITAMSEVHEAFPEKNLYFTEQMVIPQKNNPELLIAEPVARLIIGAPENWSRNVLLWNLAADPQNGPHTDNGGCPICVGAITLDGDKITRHVAYYVTAHASKFVPPGSVRVYSASTQRLPNVAFVTPKGRHVLIVSNTGKDEARFMIRSKRKEAESRLPAGAVATYVW